MYGHMQYYCIACMYQYVQCFVHFNGTVQPRLSKPLWPAPQSKRLDKQKSLDNRESIFDVWLTMPTPISYSEYHRLTV